MGRHHDLEGIPGSWGLTSGCGARCGERSRLTPSLCLLRPSQHPNPPVLRLHSSTRWELMAPVFLSENEFKKEQGGVLHKGWVGRVLRIPLWGLFSSRYRHAAGASAAAHRGRPRPLYSSLRLPRPSDTSVRLWRELRHSQAERF